MEEWRDVVGFEGIYVVSSLGRIMRVAWGRSVKPGHIKQASPNRHGYLGTQLSKCGKNYCVRVHRVVAEAFLAPIPEGMEVNHKNGDKADNRVENLEWVRHSDNLKHLYGELGHPPLIGSRDGNSKLTEEDIPEIRKLVEQGISRAQVGRMFGVSGPMISYIINGHNWKHVK